MIGFTEACHRYHCMETKPTKNLQISVREISELRVSGKLCYTYIGETGDDDHWFEQDSSTPISFCRRSISVSFFLSAGKRAARRGAAGVHFV